MVLRALEPVACVAPHARLVEGACPDGPAGSDRCSPIPRLGVSNALGIPALGGDGLCSLVARSGERAAKDAVAIGCSGEPSGNGSGALLFPMRGEKQRGLLVDSPHQVEHLTGYRRLLVPMGYGRNHAKEHLAP